MGCDEGDVEDPGGVLSPVGKRDCWDDGKTCGGQDMGIPPGSDGATSSGIIPHIGVHLETEGGHCVTNDMTPNL